MSIKHILLFALIAISTASKPASLTSTLNLKALSYIKCPDGTACQDDATCCSIGYGRYGCCPYRNAACCPDLASCCPNGYNCRDGWCERASNGFDAFHFKPKEDILTIISSLINQVEGKGDDKTVDFLKDVQIMVETQNEEAVNGIIGCITSSLKVVKSIYDTWMEYVNTGDKDKLIENLIALAGQAGVLIAECASLAKQTIRK